MQVKQKTSTQIYITTTSTLHSAALNKIFMNHSMLTAVFYKSLYAVTLWTDPNTFKMAELHNICLMKAYSCEGLLC